MNNFSKNFWPLILIGLVTFVFFSPVLGQGFILWDDNLHVVENETLRRLSWDSLKTIFTTDVSLTYIPLTVLSFALEYHAFGYNPFIFHLNNLILHLLVVGLIYVLALRLTASRTAAVSASLLFALHPMHVESVAWVTERKDVLYSFFYLLSLNCYWHYRVAKRPAFYVLSFAAAVLSVLAKPMALSLPIILCVLDWFYGKKWDRRALLEKVPFFGAVIPIAWWTYHLNSRVVDWRFPESVLTWIWTGVFYIRKFIWPIELLPLYELPKPVSIINPEYFLSVSALVFCGWVVVKFRDHRWLIFAFLYYFCSVFFLLRFDDRADLSIVADRFMYLPSLGFCILFGVLIKSLLARARVWQRDHRRLVLAGLAVFFAALGSATFQQTKIWGDPLLFWDKVIHRYPHNAMAYNQRALEFKSRGQLDKALVDYDRAIALLPGYDFAYTNRGIVLKEMGRLAQAAQDHSAAIMINPDFSEAYLNRGNVYFTAGELEMAVADYTRAIQTLNISARRKQTPYRAEVFSRRGSAYFFAKDYDRALADFDQALSIDPDNVVALDNRAIIHSIRGQGPLALQDYQRSLALVPDNPVNYVNRAMLYHQEGQRAQALADLSRALQIDPKNIRALNFQEQIRKEMDLQ